MNQPPGMQPQAGRPGQMTAVMRAMTMAAGPKVLRIGLVHGGRVIEERIIKQRTSVTVGQSEKAMFVIPAQTVPPQFKLFELIGTDYYLNFLDGMTGRVALATGISDIAALSGLVLGALALREGLTIADDLPYEVKQLAIGQAVWGAINVVAIGIAGAIVCIVLAHRATKAAKVRLEDVDRLVERLEALAENQKNQN